MAKKNSDKPVTIEEAQRVLMAEEKRKQEAFNKELEALQKKHGYRIQVNSQLVLAKI